MRVLALLCVVACAGCSSGGTDGAGGAGGAGSGGAAPVVTELTPPFDPLPGQTECKVTITDGLPLEGQAHQPVCTDLPYATNPPSSGDHWGLWAKYQTYGTPVPREMYVHDLEHGAIVMAYRCESACPEVIAALEQVAADFGVDQTCLAIENGAARSRIVITPDPLLDAPIGLAAWRATYVATCIDPMSLLAFVEDHYRTGPEDLCNDGKDPSDPTTGVLACL